MDMYIDVREKKGGEREKNSDVRERQQSDWGSTWQPECVP